MGTYVLTANPDAERGVDTADYRRICSDIRRKGLADATWTVGTIESDDEQRAQSRYGNLTGRVILLRQGGEPNKQGIIAFERRLEGQIKLEPGRMWKRIEAPVQFYRAAALDEEPLITTDQLRQYRFPQNPKKRFQGSGREIKDDELAALESCCLELCGLSLSVLCSPQSDDPDASRDGVQSKIPDEAHNARVEAAATEHVLKHFLGHQVTDRQKDNCGWDYEFTVGGRTLCVEVKGLSGADIHVEVTPNEFQAMERSMNGRFAGGEYRLAVVCKALSETPTLFLFAHDTGMEWLCELSRRRIMAFPRTAARLE